MNKNKRAGKIFIILGITLISFYVAFQIITYNPQAIPEKPSSKKYLPDTNITCESLIPENLTIRLGYTGSAGLSPSNIMMQNYNSNCNSNTQVGQKIDEFTCTAYKNIKNRVSPNGIILRNYMVQYNFLFSEKNCTKFSSRQYSKLNQDYLNCKMIKSSCDWAYI